MDKHKNSRTITIKINGIEKIYPAPQELAVEEEIDTDKGEIVFFENDKGITETAASEEIVDESFDWILPEITRENYELNEYKIVNGDTQKKHVKTDSIIGRKKYAAYRSLLFAVLIAVLVGTSFGVIMLKLVVSVHPAKQAVPTVSNENTPSIPPPKYTIKLKPFSAFVVQGGVFSSKESASQAAKIALGKGVPSQIINIGGKECLFLGTAENIDNAKAVGSELAKLGFEKYAKQITFPEKTFSSLTKAEQDFLQKSSSVFYDLASAASSALINEQPAKDTLARIQEFSSNSPEIDGKNSANALIKQLDIELLNAAKLILAHRNVNDRDLAVKAEQHLLTFLMIYNSI